MLLRPALALGLLLTPAAAQQQYMDTVDVGGVTRQFLVYVPASYDASVEAPMMFNFHGGDMTAMDMMNLADMRPLAEANAFVLIYPQGLPEPGGGPIWNSLGPYDNGTDEMGFALAMLAKLDNDLSVDLDRAYACGYSNGGNLVYDLSCTLSDHFAAIAAVAGNMFQWTYDACSPSSQTAVLTIHGTADFTYNRYDGLPPYTVSLPDTNAYWVAINGADPNPTVEQLGSSTERFTWAPGDDCFGVQHYKVNGGGHDWFGAWGPSDFDSNEAIWEFASQFSRQGLIDCGDSPSTYCESNPNSDGGPALISWTGSNSVAQNDLVLYVAAATKNQAGLFFYGPEQKQVPLGAGYLCVGGSIRRLPVVFTDLFGFVSYPLDLTDPSQSTFVIQPGETWNFQLWYRDPSAGGGSTSNLSNGLSVPFVQ